jgi:hypothetical protein
MGSPSPPPLPPPPTSPPNPPPNKSITTRKRIKCGRRVKELEQKVGCSQNQGCLHSGADFMNFNQGWILDHTLESPLFGQSRRVQLGDAAVCEVQILSEPQSFTNPGPVLRCISCLSAQTNRTTTNSGGKNLSNFSPDCGHTFPSKLNRNRMRTHIET